MTLGRFIRACAAVAIILSGAPDAFAQGSVQQSGGVVSGHASIWLQSGQIMDGGAAQGGAAGTTQSELGLTVRGTGSPPYANMGTGPNGENACDYDAPTNNSTGYHFFCFSPNAQGGGLLDYGFGGGAAALPLNFLVNGTLYTFPFVTGGIVGPTITKTGDAVCWGNTAGTLVTDCGPASNAFRIIATGATDTATTADNTIAWNSASTSAKTETLYACASGQKGYPLYIKDEAGSAGAHAITLTPNGSNTIDKASSYSMQFNLQGVSLQCDGAGNWIVK